MAFESEENQKMYFGGVGQRADCNQEAGKAELCILGAQNKLIRLTFKMVQQLHHSKKLVLVLNST